MSFILDILGSAGFGTVLGGVFGWLGKREERENLKLQFEHQVSMLQAKSDAATKVAQLTMDQAKIAGTLAVERVEAEAFQESQKASSPISEVIKSMVRPIVLGLLMYQTYLIIQTLETLTGGLQGLESSEVLSLYRIIVLSVTGLTATAVGWYFAQRTSKQFDKLLSMNTTP